MACEERGLMAPTRSPSGYREYGDADVGIVRRIRTLLAGGLGTETITEVLTCMFDDGDRVVPACPDLLPVLIRERDRIDASLAELTRDALQAIIAAPIPVEGCDDLDVTAPKTPTGRPAAGLRCRSAPAR
ncbi:MAG: MerR family transcriptional regulator [Pseudonocardiaceae bacterium]